MHTMYSYAFSLMLLGLEPLHAAPVETYALQTQLIPERYITSDGDVKPALMKAGIIPDVLDDFQPDLSISLSYASSHHNVDLGNDISPTDTTSAPVFVIKSLSTLAPTRTLGSNTTYTLVLTDPDATSRANPVMGEMCHWIATGIKIAPSSSVNNLPSSKGHVYQLHFDPASGNNFTELLPYLPPSPPPMTGKHRYVFVLLAPSSDESKMSDLRKPKERPHWGYGKVGKGVRDWAEDNGLVVVGKLVGP